LHKLALQRLLRICSHFRRLERSVPRFRPLRRKFTAFQGWLAHVEFNYAHVTRGLKRAVRRRHELRERLGQLLEAFAARASTSAIVPSRQQLFQTVDFVFASWAERAQNKAARRAVEALTRRRWELRRLHHVLDFLRFGVIRRGSDHDSYFRYAP